MHDLHDFENGQIVGARMEEPLVEIIKPKLHHSTPSYMQATPSYNQATLSYT